MDARLRTIFIFAIATVATVIFILAVSHRAATKAATTGGAGQTATCKGSKPCLIERNGGHGPGLVAGTIGAAGIITRSENGFGLLGETSNDAANNFNTGAGVYGADDSIDPAGGNQGVLGTTTYGVGVVGATFNMSQEDNQGTAAVVGVDEGDGDLNIGVQGIAVGTAMLAVSLGPQQPAGQQQFPALAALCTGGSLAMTADNGYGSPIGDVMSLDCAGNMILKGSIVSDGVPLMRVGGPGHAARAAYAAEQARPAIEDDGEGSIVVGAGYVAIDAAFAQAADVAHGYSVFLTPEGPSLGLYVTAKSPSGFAVRENPGGHASIGFAYRIVATPVGAHGGRLPDMASVQTALYREAAAAPHNAAIGRGLLRRLAKTRAARPSSM